MAIDFGNRAPSNQNNYDLFWSKDPAFLQDGPDHDRKVERAKETGDWSELLIQGQTPTKFVARQIPGEIKRRLLDRFRADKIGPSELDSTLVRIAIVDVSNFGTFKLSFTKHDDWGRVATADIIDELDKYAEGAVGDLGVQIFNRMMGISGKF